MLKEICEVRKRLSSTRTQPLSCIPSPATQHPNVRERSYTTRSCMRVSHNGETSLMIQDCRSSGFLRGILFNPLGRKKSQ